MCDKTLLFLVVTVRVSLWKGMYCDLYRDMLLLATCPVVKIALVKFGMSLIIQ